MKQILLFFLNFLIFSSGNAQVGKTSFDTASFEKEILSYQPNKKDLSEKDYKHGLMILNAVKRDVESNPSNFGLADYFNVLSSFLTLKESRENVEIVYNKFKNSDGSCEYFLYKKTFQDKKFDLIRKDIEKQIAICSNSEEANPVAIDLKEYASKNKLNYKLVYLLDEVSQLDVKYRKEETTDWSKQRPLDLRNQVIIDSLYSSHQKYIGTSFVGEKYKEVMWSIVQHSNPEMMEKYLPIIQKAVQEKELGVTPLKMLIDRYYGLKYGYQVFGSQSGFGFEMADDKQKKEILLKYGIKSIK